MLINNTDNNIHVKFVSYDGKYPCLCGGTLVLEIDGSEYSFGNKGKFPKFWLSGGTCGFTDNWEANVVSGEWIINADEIPEQFKQYANEFDEIFNGNVAYGCCGGCIQWD